MNTYERTALCVGAAKQAESSGHILIKEKEGPSKGSVKWLVLGDKKSVAAVCSLCSLSVCVDRDGQVLGDALGRQCPGVTPKAKS